MVSDSSSAQPSVATASSRGTQKGRQLLHRVVVSLVMQSRAARIGGASPPSVSATEARQTIYSFKPLTILRTRSLFRYGPTRSCLAHILGRVAGRCLRQEATAIRSAGSKTRSLIVVRSSLLTCGGFSPKRPVSASVCTSPCCVEDFVSACVERSGTQLLFLCAEPRRARTLLAQWQSSCQRRFARRWSPLPVARNFEFGSLDRHHGTSRIPRSRTQAN